MRVGYVVPDAMKPFYYTTTMMIETDIVGVVVRH
jgi:hypothetical protein